MFMAERINTKWGVIQTNSCNKLANNSFDKKSAVEGNFYYLSIKDSTNVLLSSLVFRRRDFLSFKSQHLIKANLC